MAKLTDEFSTDAESVETGKWFTLRAAKKGEGGKPDTSAVRVRIRAVTSKAFRRAEQKLQRQYRGKFAQNGGYLDIDDQDEYDVLLCQRGVLVEWDGIESDDGKPIPYAPQNVVRVLTEYPQLRREIFVWARIDDNFKPAEQQRAEQEAVIKN